MQTARGVNRHLLCLWWNSNDASCSVIGNVKSSVRSITGELNSKNPFILGLQSVLTHEESLMEKVQNQLPLDKSEGQPLYAQEPKNQP